MPATTTETKRDDATDPEEEEKGGRGERAKRRRELDYRSTGARRLGRASYLAIRRRPAASEGTGCGR